MIKRLRFIENFHENTIPFRNLAIEEYLLQHAEEGECTLYLWQNAHTVVIGRNQNAWKECRVRQLEEEGGYLARRLSGGGAVYHDLGNLNFTFIVRENDYDVDRQLFVILDAVRAFGIEAEKSGRNDIVIDAHKFSGNAFYRHGGSCWHHGTLMVSVDMDMLTRYLNVSKAKLETKGVASVRSRVVNLTECDPEMTVDSLAEQLKISFGRVYGLPVETIDCGDLDSNEIAAREKRFASVKWRLDSSKPFTSEIEERFGWGGLSLRFLVEKGVVKEASVNSDGLEADFIAALPKALIGCRYDAMLLAQRLDILNTESDARREIARDAISLILARLD